MKKTILAYLCATLLVSVNALAMSSSKNKADRTGSTVGATSSTGSTVTPATPSTAGTYSGDSTTGSTMDSNRGITSDTSYDSTTRSNPPTTGVESSLTFDSNTNRAQTDRECDANDTQCIENKRAAEDSSTR